MSNFTIDDPNAIVDGKTIAQWTQDWWTWEMESPANHNAFDDKTGQYAHVGNNQPVFFIAGTFSSNGGEVDATRTFTVPHGKPLLVPLINAFDTLDSQEAENQTVGAFPASVTDVFAKIDGNPIVPNPRDYLETTDFFSLGTLRPSTFIAEQFPDAIPNLIPYGTNLTPTKATGYYLMIEGLSPGQHTLEFGGSLAGGFSTHVVDHISVA